MNNKLYIIAEIGQSEQERFEVMCSIAVTVVQQPRSAFVGEPSVNF